MDNDSLVCLLRQLARHMQDNTVSVQAAFDCLSEDERSALKKFHKTVTSGGAGNRNGERTKTKKIADIVKIEIPDGLKHFLSSCVVDHSVFFGKTESDSHPYKTAGALFHKISRDETQEDILTITRRFDLRALFRFALAGNYHTGRSWRTTGCHRLAEYIHHRLPTSGGITEIENKLAKYIPIGLGYDHWAVALGDPSYLLILPLEVSETEYAERHSHGKIVGGAAHFVKIGIKDIAEVMRIFHLGKYISDNTLRHVGTLPPLRKKRTRTKTKCGTQAPLKKRSQAKSRHPDTRVPPNAPPQIPVNVGNTGSATEGLTYRNRCLVHAD
ncbi:hypothetical protein AJ80_10067 [Polytolypa hystricis UAMH7299]|uniref:Uncharacterized protein n=1 Tax=Polytolypa hystricis (strain UAMH7299) TaxID=1447883 RepID=A0A2B7WEF5_POLH7|nr:hypothetical protein AJ80_10067 [Polytolypa hystricis UAMH7299]